jgi:phosphomannomutase
LGVAETVELYCDPTGEFPHNPEPLPEHLKDLCDTVVKHKADVGFAVDPDVDRLAMVCEDGSLFGEEYTLVACADHVLASRPGDTVSNLSSTRALDDVAERHGRKRHASAVGEVNVVELMRKVNAPIGGEGNGGVILSELHYGRDALVGIAIFLTLLAKNGNEDQRAAEELPGLLHQQEQDRTETGNGRASLRGCHAERTKAEKHSTVDGLRIEFGKEWVHLRKSNTEPIVRIYAESDPAPTRRMRWPVGSWAR